MSMPPENPETRFHRALRSLPDRRAPASLEERVMAELARRAAQPWWRRSYLSWPMPLRAAFLLGSAAAAALLVHFAVRFGAWTEIGSAASAARGALERSQGFVNALSQTVAALLGDIPPLWLDAIAGLAALSCAALAGLGAAAYRSPARPSAFSS